MKITMYLWPLLKRLVKIVVGSLFMYVTMMVRNFYFHIQKNGYPTMKMGKRLYVLEMSVLNI